MAVFGFFFPLQSVPELKWSFQPVCARAEVFGASLKMTVIAYDFFCAGSGVGFIAHTLSCQREQEGEQVFYYYKSFVAHFH